MAVITSGSHNDYPFVTACFGRRRHPFYTLIDILIQGETAVGRYYNIGRFGRNSAQP